MYPLACLVLAFLVSTSIHAIPLSESAWESPEQIGEISIEQLPEASGMAQSLTQADRLYHINDAGSAASFVMTDRYGADARTIQLQISALIDSEDLATGGCPDTGSCLYIADIGDNKAKRPFILIHVVRDVLNMPDTVKPVFSVKLHYPNGESHNAESFAIHPSGFVYILTKEVPATFYRFSIAAMRSQTSINLEKVGFIDLSPWLAGTGKPDKIVPTGMDIRPDGKQIVILTRSAGVSLNVDLNQAFVQGRQDLNQALKDLGGRAERLPMIQLAQSEAIAYLDEGSAILYSSEISETGGTVAPLIRIKANKMH
jgi:hypothetical protein